jgi:hypothetical protein
MLEFFSFGLLHCSKTSNINTLKKMVDSSEN